MDAMDMMDIMDGMNRMGFIFRKMKNRPGLASSACFYGLP
jgi:hypothetical protein